MMSGQQIADMSRQAARKAARDKKYPLIVEAEDLKNGVEWAMKYLRFPFIGDWRPRGYTPTENLFFVDSSGFGSPGEAALTQEEFLAKLRPGFAYAVVEAGQFQVYVQEYVVKKYNVIAVAPRAK